VLNVPNVITVARMLLIPVIAYLLVEKNYGWALAAFMAAAFSDFADGVIARHYRLVSEFGARLDPIADKLTMFTATVLLAWQGWLPLWLAAAIVLRDVVIAGGAIAYRIVVGHVDMQPTWLSKINTALEFAALAGLLAHAAALIDGSAWLQPLFVLVCLTVTLSGAQYVWVWGRKAAAARRAQRGGGGALGGGG
jgi:cardiolipin synthase